MNKFPIWLKGMFTYNRSARITQQKLRFRVMMSNGFHVFNFWLNRFWITWIRACWLVTRMLPSLSIVQSSKLRVCTTINKSIWYMWRILLKNYSKAWWLNSQRTFLCTKEHLQTWKSSSTVTLQAETKNICNRWGSV